MPQRLNLNLRTILDYLDDALEPSQAKQIGERIAESKQAQELIERIKTVTRKRRLTTPPETAKIDPNTIAEFLDGTLSPEQQVEVEEICQSSDVHLAEVAACHQILSNAKGEAELVPPTAKQRMVRLAHDSSSSSGIRAGAPSTPIPQEGAAKKPFALDDLVNKGKRYKSYVLLGAGLLGGVLLAVAIFQVLQMSENPPGPELVAKNGDKKNDENIPEKKKDDAPTIPKKVDKVDDAKKPEKVEPPIRVEKPPEKVEPEPKKPDPEPKKVDPPPVEISFPAFEEPSPLRGPVGDYAAPLMNQPTILLQAGDRKDEWRRIDDAKPEVVSAQPLVSLPGCRSTVMLQGGIRLTLWGNLPEIIPTTVIPIQESIVELYLNPAVDADVTLKRGRIVLTNMRDDRSGLARVRFANPTDPASKEFMDIRLYGKGTEVLIDRWSKFAPNEKYFSNPKDPLRLGPTAEMGVVILNGDVELKFGDVTHGMQAPPGKAVLLWNSQAGARRDGAAFLDKLPDLVLPNPMFKEVPAQIRTEMLKARDDLSVNLSGKTVNVALKEARSSEDLHKRRLAIRCFGALDDVLNIVEALEDKQAAVRAEGILTARAWLAVERDNDYTFNAALQSKYNPLESEKIMGLLHDLTQSQLATPETYDFLIDSLDNPRLIFRELARFNLYALVEAGRGIPYAADADAALRQKAQAAWRALIPQGKLPKQMK